MSMANTSTTSLAMRPETLLATLYEDDLKIGQLKMMPSHAPLVPSPLLEVSPRRPGSKSDGSNSLASTAAPEYERCHLTPHPATYRTAASRSRAGAQRLAVARLYETSCAESATLPPQCFGPAEYSTHEVPSRAAHRDGLTAAQEITATSPRSCVEWPAVASHPASIIWGPTEAVHSSKCGSSKRSEINQKAKVLSLIQTWEGCEVPHRTELLQQPSGHSSRVYSPAHDRQRKAHQTNTRPGSERVGQYSQDNRVLYAQIRAAIDAIGNGRGGCQRCALWSRQLLYHCITFTLGPAR
jgi:hypothetical protein